MSTSTIARNGSIRRVSAAQGGDGRSASASPRTVGRRSSVEKPRGVRLQTQRQEWRRPVGAQAGRAGNGAQVSTAVHSRSRSQAASNTWVVAIFVAVLLVVASAAVIVRGIGIVDTTTSVGVIEVQPGDTLGSIAAHNAPGLAVGSVVGQIRSLNDMADAHVEVGQKLRVPVTADQ